MFLLDIVHLAAIQQNFQPSDTAFLAYDAVWPVARSRACPSPRKNFTDDHPWLVIPQSICTAPQSLLGAVSPLFPLCRPPSTPRRDVCRVLVLYRWCSACKNLAHGFVKRPGNCSSLFPTSFACFWRPLRPTFFLYFLCASVRPPDHSRACFVPEGVEACVSMFDRPQRGLVSTLARRSCTAL